MNNRIALGRFGSPYGIKGWIKVISYTDPIDNILAYLPWILFKGDKEITLEKVRGKIHSNNLIVQFEQCLDRNEAQTYTNLEIFIDREQLPELTNEEYYWVDLIGLTVLNKENTNLGKVDHLFATGSNDVLVVKDEEARERYIPYTESVIIEVNLDKKTLIVDWDATF